MFLFDKLFGRREKIAVQSSPSRQAAPTSAVPVVDPNKHVAPGTRIHHHPELIQKFLHDHQMLLRLYKQTKSAADAGDVVAAAERLDDFRSALQDHLLTENVRLYVYLEHALGQDQTSYNLVHEFRREMDGIGKAVVDFLGKYHDLAQHPEKAASFSAELDGVGKVLVKRIQREEETLYPLYQPV